MDNAASRKDIRRKEKESRIADRERAGVILSVMATRAGRGWAWDRLAEAHVFSTSYSPDALQMAFAEGERNAGLRLLNDIIEWCPEQFIQMMREQNERRDLNPDPDAGTDAESFPDDTDDGSVPGADIYARSYDP
jgi:hypothetical protein